MTHHPLALRAPVPPPPGPRPEPTDMLAPLHRLRGTTDATVALFLPLAIAGQDAFVTGVLAAARPGTDHRLATLEGRSFRELGWRVVSLLPAGEPGPTELPLPGQCARAAFGGLVVRGEHVLGWLGVLLGASASPPGRRTRQAWADAARALLDAPHPPAALLSRPARYVFTETGRPWMQTVSDATRAEFTDALGAVVRTQGTTREDEHTTVLHGAVVRLTRMRGPGGSGWLVEAQPGHAPPLPLLARLTAAQRAVAAFAAAGATANEIARALNRSPETVRTHLKRAYAALGLANRVELSRLFEVEWDGLR